MTGSTAIILAAGAGSRLGELGRRYSKPMLPIADRPLIDWVVARLRAAGVADIVVVGHESDESLANFLTANHPDIRRLTQSARRGIADAVRLALPLVVGERGFVACACDSLFDADDIARLIAVGRQSTDAAAVGVLEMGIDATASRSAVRLDGDRVVEIVEKPLPGVSRSGMVAMPLYWLPRRAALYVESVAPIGAEAYVSSALNDFIRGGGIVRAVRVRARLEITTAADVAQATAALRDQR